MVGNDTTWALSGAPAEVACFHGELNFFMGHLLLMLFNPSE